MYFFHKNLVPFKMEVSKDGYCGIPVAPETASGNDGTAKTVETVAPQRKTAGGNGNGGGMMALEMASQTSRTHPPPGFFSF